MKPERAIKILKELTFVKVLENNAHSNIAYHSESDCKKDNEDFAAIQMAISALEYRTPKKPDEDTINRGLDVSGEYDIEYNYVCPACRAVVGNYEIEEHWYDFCPDCGQALDWSEEK